MKTIGFVGLGTMGLPMAENLLKKGYSVSVYNRTQEKAAELARKGAEALRSPAEVTRSVDVLFTMLSNDSVLKEVFYGAGGIMDGLHPGLTIIDSSTTSPALSRQLFQELSGHYVDFLDAPVTGSKPAAINGSLLFMIGGKEEVFNEHRELFSSMGNKLIYMGPSGSGSTAKLAHNTVVGINAIGLIEGLSIAAKSGIDVTRFLEIVRLGSAGSKQAELKGDKILDHDFSNQFSLQLMLKDLNLAADLTNQLQAPTPLLQAARAVFQMGAAKGLGAEDMCAVAQCYEDWIQQPISRNNDMANGGRKSAPVSENERRKSPRILMDIKLQLSVYQWEQEGAFTGQNVEATLYDISNTGLQIASPAPLAEDMFVVIHFPQNADLPPITGKIIRVETYESGFRYGCLLSGLAIHTRLKLDNYIHQHLAQKK